MEPIDWRTLSSDDKYELVNRVILNRFSLDRPSLKEIFDRMNQTHLSCEYYPLSEPPSIMFYQVGQPRGSCPFLPNKYEGVLKAALRALGVQVDDGIDPLDPRFL